MKTLVGLIVVALAVAPVWAQTDVTASPAELAIPFGVAAGKVVIIGEDLVFVNDQDPASSFAISRSNLVEAAFKDQVLTVRTREKIGDRSEFAFRTTDTEFAEAALSWGERSVTPREAVAAASPAPSAESFRFAYDVENKRGMFSKNDRGRLIVTEDRMTYESVTDADESEQWDLKDIKEVKRKNPYKLEVVPFVGGAYTFNLLRDGMSTRDYKTIIDRMADLRAPK